MALGYRPEEWLETGGRGMPDIEGLAMASRRRTRQVYEREPDASPPGVEIKHLGLLTPGKQHAASPATPPVVADRGQPSAPSRSRAGYTGGRAPSR